MDPRTVGGIQKKVVKQGKRNVVSRHFHARNDKEAINAWRSDLNRILHVFNVRSVVFVWSLLTFHSQTELVINTHVMVTDIQYDVANTRTVVSELHHNVANTQAIVSGIHSTMMKNQEGAGGQNMSVSATHAYPSLNKRSSLHRLTPDQQSRSPVENPHHRRRGPSLDATS